MLAIKPVNALAIITIALLFQHDMHLAVAVMDPVFGYLPDTLSSAATDR